MNVYYESGHPALYVVIAGTAGELHELGSVLLEYRPVTRRSEQRPNKNYKPLDEFRFEPDPALADWLVPELSVEQSSFTLKEEASGAKARAITDQFL